MVPGATSLRAHNKGHPPIIPTALSERSDVIYLITQTQLPVPMPDSSTNSQTDGRRTSYEKSLSDFGTNLSIKTGGPTVSAFSEARIVELVGRHASNTLTERDKTDLVSHFAAVGRLRSLAPASANGSGRDAQDGE